MGALQIGEQGQGEPLWVPVRGDSLWLPEGGPFRPLADEEWRWFGAEVQFQLHMGSLDGRPLWAAHITSDPAAQGDFATLRSMLLSMPGQDFAVASRALQLVAWGCDHQFCGRCGKATQMMDAERAMRCGGCGALWYPRISPCAIAVVRRGQEILLGHNVNFPEGMYSAMAGFLEAGESAEQAAAREILEETSVEAGDFRYVASQSWPFPAQLMLGFIGEYRGGEVKPDGVELADAGWFRYDQLPRVPPPGVSVAGQLIALAVQQAQQEG